MQVKAKKSRPATRNTGPFDCYCDHCGSLMIPIVATDERRGLTGLLPVCVRCDEPEAAR
jgi:hypothetical protein